MEYAAILLSFAALFFLEVRWSDKKTLSMPILFTAYWGVLIGVGIPLYWESFPFDYRSFYWILLMCALFWGGDRISVCWLKRTGRYDRTVCLEDPVHSQPVSMMIRIVRNCLLLRLAGVLYYMALNDIGLLDVVLPSRFLSTLNRLTLLKYHALPTKFSPLISITNTLSFTGLLLLGLYGKDFPGKARWKMGGLAASVFCFSMVIFASKSDIIFAVLLFCAGLFVRLMIDQFDFVGWGRQHKKLLLGLILLGIAGILLLSLFIVVRSGFQKGMMDGLKQYGFGMIPTFDRYFASMRPDKLAWGQYTLYGVWDFLGLGNPDVTQGIYREISLGAGNYASNVFTAFRSLIDDFGLPGCAAFFVLMGVLHGILTNRCRADRTLALAPSVLCFLAFFLLNSFLISAGNYFSVCLAHGFLYLILGDVKGRWAKRKAEVCSWWNRSLPWLRQRRSAHGEG